MHNLFKSTLACLALGVVGSLAACDHLGTTAERKAIEEPIACGGFAGIECPDGLTCVDDPNDDCDPDNGGADCGGICEPAPAPTYCGGFANIACPKDQVCVDDPNDDCDPKHGGADCGGICEPAPKHPHKPRKPHKPHHHDRCDDAHTSYVSHSPATCAALRFICSEGQSPFFDDCGCGCE